MDERVRFIAAVQGGMGMGEACRGFGISRKSGYKWLNRYKLYGPRGLEELSRAPHRMPWAMSPEMAELIVGLKCEHPSWGPRTLLKWLQRRHPGNRFPAASSVGELLRRRGLVKPRRRRRRFPAHTSCPGQYDKPNATWCADFKGWFRVGDGRRCDPLTVSDGHSRFLLCCRIVERPSLEPVKREFEKVFQEYGLPEALRTDNGPPFASSGLAGLSRLAVWWLKLGINPDRIEPGKPQQNGRHERFHRTLKAETASPPASSLRAQQNRFDHMREVYNFERPHQALDGDTPATHYRPSPRAYPLRVSEPEYPTDYVLRSVRTNGTIKWKARELFVSEALVGEVVGLQPIDDDRWLIRFASLALAVLDARAPEARIDAI